MTPEQREREKSFCSARNRLHQLLNNSFPPCQPIDGRLYHYTTAAGLIGIVSTGSLWATSSQYLNDPEEWKYGANLAVSTLRGLNSSSCLTAKAIEQLVETLRAGSLGSNSYVACFCVEGDLLTQWRNYADKGGGYCIEFDRQIVQEWTARHAGRLLQVEYKPEIQTDLLEQYLRRSLELLKKDAETNSDPADSWVRAAKIQLRLVVLPLIMAFKHPAFRDEGERRLCYFLGSGGILDEYSQVKHRPGRGFVIPYLPLNLASKPWTDTSSDSSPLPILSVRCGPTTHPELGKSGIISLLERYGYRDVQIETSSVPYRG